jgi:hypothetical protein
MKQAWNAYESTPVGEDMWPNQMWTAHHSPPSHVNRYQLPRALDTGDLVGEKQYTHEVIRNTHTQIPCEGILTCF